MTPTLDTPVLIAGGGPTGLVLASVLAANGVNCLLAERNPSTTRFPKMDITTGPSMELLRRLSVDRLINGFTRMLVFAGDLPLTLAFQVVGPANGFAFFHGDHLLCSYR